MNYGSGLLRTFRGVGSWGTLVFYALILSAKKIYEDANVMNASAPGYFCSKLTSIGAHLSQPTFSPDMSLLKTLKQWSK